MRMLVLLGVGVWMSGCAGLRPSSPEIESSGSGRDPGATESIVAELLPFDALREDVLMRQHVSVRWSDHEESFDAVLQKNGESLLLLGLGPMNSVGFSLTLDGDGVHFDNRSGREMPFQPERILADVQRVFYPWIQESSACVECERRELRGGLEIAERIGPRFLEERRFKWVDQPDRGEIAVRYEGWTKGGLAPKRAILENGWFGYRLIIDTTSVEPID